MNAETTNVSFSYSIQDMPSWTSNADFRNAIPYVRGVLTAPEKHRMLVSDLTLLEGHWSMDNMSSVPWTGAPQLVQITEKMGLRRRPTMIRITEARPRTRPAIISHASAK
jgi:hypothetical protein